MQLMIRQALALFLLLAAAGAHADDPVYTGLFDNRAVSGHDTVAYFTEGRPVEGSREFRTEYMGAEWRFSSAANLALFEADPERYAPQYGGYCAWAVSQGYTASGDPDNWSIENGRLYLNYNDEVQATWNGDRAGFIEAANGNWPSVLD
jgi:YHS domain-containing protein